MDQLPVELLCMIFDRLDLESIKNASLTCHRWERIIFSNHYIKRFAFRSLLSNNSTKHEMKQMARLMKKSQRCYPNLKLEFDHQSEYTEHAFHVLFRTMSSHILDQLVVLKLLLKLKPYRKLQMVCNELPKIRSLAALHIVYSLDDRPYNYQLHLKSDSLQHLEADVFVPASEDPLKFIDIGMYKAPPPISFKTCHLPNLGHIRLGCNTFELAFLRSVGTVETLELLLPKRKGPIVEMMRAIGKHLPNLTVLKLNLRCADEVDTEVMLFSLHLLSTVRELELKWGYFNEFSPGRNTQPMPQLRKLRLQRCKLRPQKLPWMGRIFPNLTQFEIYPNPSLQQSRKMEVFKLTDDSILHYCPSLLGELLEFGI